MKLKEFFAKTQGSRQLRLTGQKEAAMCGRDFWGRYRNTEAWEMEVSKVTLIPARATIGALWFDTVICEIELDTTKKPQEAPDKMEFLRDFLEGKTRWNFPEGTVFNVNISTGDGEEVQLKKEADGEEEVYRRAHRRDLLEEWIEREGPEKCHKYIDEVRRLKGLE